MATKYAFVVSACKKYTPEITALLNSLDFIGNKYDVHLSGYELPTQFLSQLGKLNYTVFHHPISEPDARQYGGESEMLCRRRYWDAANWGQNYDAICILDADMFFVRPVDAFFHIAHKAGLILGATLEQKRLYGHIEHHKLGDGTKLLPEPRWNEKDICCAPIFMDTKLYCATFKKSWLYFVQGFKAPDMEAINIAIMVDNFTDNVVLLSNPQFVGTNEKLLKPYIRAVRQDQDPTPGSKIWTETGDPIYIVHGQFYKAKWRKQQLLNRQGCINGYIGGSEKCENMARGALDFLTNVFFQMLDYKIQVDKKAYVPRGEPTEEEWLKSEGNAV